MTNRVPNEKLLTLVRGLLESKRTGPATPEEQKLIEDLRGDYVTRRAVELGIDPSVLKG